MSGGHPTTQGVQSFLEQLRSELEAIRADYELDDIREASGKYGDPPYFDLAKLHERTQAEHKPGENA